jgi:hypothetical protein
MKFYALSSLPQEPEAAISIRYEPGPQGQPDVITKREMATDGNPATHWILTVRS